MWKKKRLKTENIEKWKTMSQHLPPQKQVWREIPFHGQLRINFCETQSEKSGKQTLRNRIFEKCLSSSSSPSSNSCFTSKRQFRNNKNNKTDRLCYWRNYGKFRFNSSTLNLHPKFPWLRNTSKSTSVLVLVPRTII